MLYDEPDPPNATFPPYIRPWRRLASLARRRAVARMVRRPAEAVRADIVIPNLQYRGPTVPRLPTLLDVHFRSGFDARQLRPAARFSVARGGVPSAFDVTSTVHSPVSWRAAGAGQPRLRPTGGSARSAAPPNLADAPVSTHSCAHAEQPSTRARVGAVMGSVVPHRHLFPGAVPGARRAGRHAVHRHRRAAGHRSEE